MMQATLRRLKHSIYSQMADEFMDIDDGASQTTPALDAPVDTKETPQPQCKCATLLLPPVSRLRGSGVWSALPAAKESFREIHVKVHIRTPDRDSWRYLGRAVVSQEVTGQSSRVGKHRASWNPLSDSPFFRL